MSKVPNIFHFCYFGGRPLGLLEYLSVKSTYEVNKPEAIYFYCDQQLQGEWWEKIKPMVTFEHLEPFDQRFGVPVPYPSHKADLTRLEKLIERGGIYLDLDVICRNPFTPLMNHRVVVAQELVAGNLVGLGSAVILAQKGEQFIERWYEGFDPKRSLWKGHRSAGPQDKYFTEIAVKYARFLATYWPEELHIEPVESFFEPTYAPDRMKLFFEDKDDGSFDSSYCHHIWSVAKQQYAKQITIEEIKVGESSFAKLAQRFI